MPHLSPILINNPPHTHEYPQTVGCNEMRSIQANCEERLNKISGPQLSKFLPQRRVANADGRGEAVEKFKGSGEFPEFRAALLDSLENIHRTTADAQSPGFDNSYWGRFAKRLDLMAYHQPRENVFNHELYDLYGDPCTLINRMSLMLDMLHEHRAHFDEDTQAELIRQLKYLGSELSLCAPGVMQKIISTYISMKYRLLPPDFQTLFQETRLQIAREHMTRMVRHALKHDIYLPNNEIHIVASFQNAVASALDLPRIDDRYSTPRHVTDAGYDSRKLLDKLRPLLCASHVCRVIADRALEQLQGHMVETTREKETTYEFNQRLHDQIGKIKPMVGEVPTNLLASDDTDPQPGHHSVFKNATLLAAHLYGRYEKLPTRKQCPVPTSSLQLSSNRFTESHLRSQGALAWIEDVSKSNGVSRNNEGDKRFFTLKDFSTQAVDELLTHRLRVPALITFSAYEALRNSDLPGMTYFRQVPATSALTALTEAAVAAAFATLPAGLNTDPRLTEYLTNGIHPSGAAQLLLSENAELLSPAQEDYLLDISLDANTSPLSNGHGPRFIDFVIKLHELPCEDLFKVSPRLYKKTLQKLQTPGHELANPRGPLLNEPNPAYRKAAREIPELEPLLRPEQLLMNAVKNFEATPDESNFYLINRLIDRLTAPGELAADFTLVIEELINSSLSDQACMPMIAKLINKSTEQLKLPNTADEFKHSLLGKAFKTKGLACVERLLTELSGQLPASTHKEIWTYFGEALNRGSEPALSMRILESLVEKGVRVQLPEENTSALLTIGLYAPYPINDKLVQLGCDPAAQDQAGRNLLSQAIEKQLPSSRFNELLSLGVPVEKHGEKCPIIELALAIYDPSTICRLYYLAGGLLQLNKLDSEGYGILHRTILKAADPRLLISDKQMEIKRLEALLMVGCDANLRASAKHMYKTPLHLANKYLPEVRDLLIRHHANRYALDLKLRFANNMKPKNT